MAVNKATDGRQTPWDSSSLTEDFRFSGSAVPGPKLAATKKTVEEWTRDLKGKPVEAANEIIVADGTDESYEAFAILYAADAARRAGRDWLVRHRRMVAWNDAVVINTAAGYRAFLAKFPDSDLTADRAQAGRAAAQPSRSGPVVVAGVGCAKRRADLSLQRAGRHRAPQLKKVDAPIKRVDPDPPRRVDRAPPKRVRPVDDDVVVVRRPPPPREVYEPAPGPSIGIGIGIGGGGGYGGNYGGQHRGGGRY